MKLYFPHNHYDVQYRRQVFPLLKAFIKEKDFTDAERILVYGVSNQDFLIVDTIDASDVVILPMSWNYYVGTKKIFLAYELIDKAEQAGKLVWSINNGDFGIKLPYFKNLVVFRQSGYVSNNQLGHTGFPSIINDYVKKNKIEDTFLNSKYSIQPIVGFCGLANGSILNSAKDKLKQVLRNLRYELGYSAIEPQRVLSTNYLRASLLKRLESNKAVSPLFIKRKQYRAGITKNKEVHKTTIEFYNNILDSQYVLCVRGAGNFSVRYYETLMMGRIPLYVHTDGYLPLSDIINWKEHVVWVDYKDRHHIAEILLNFHQELDQDSLIGMFKKNRKLWEEKLTLGGFFESYKRRVKRNL